MFGWLFGKSSVVEIEEAPAVESRRDRYSEFNPDMASSGAKTVMRVFFTHIRRLLHDLEVQLDSEKADLLLEKKPIPTEWLDINFNEAKQKLFTIEVLLEADLDKQMLRDMVTNTMGNVILPLLMKTKKTGWMHVFEDEAFHTQKTINLL